MAPPLILGVRQKAKLGLLPGGPFNVHVTHSYVKLYCQKFLVNQGPSFQAFCTPFLLYREIPPSWFLVLQARKSKKERKIKYLPRRLSISRVKATGPWARALPVVQMANFNHHAKSLGLFGRKDALWWRISGTSIHSLGSLWFVSFFNNGDCIMLISWLHV
jgi:hypothetical protein